MTDAFTEQRATLLAAFRAAITAADPGRLVASSAMLARLIADPPSGRCVVIGMGKAAATMAAALEAHWPLPQPPEGIVVTRAGYGENCHYITVIEAAHPRPDNRCADAARRIAELASTLRQGDRVLGLVSGGGSSLLSWPIANVELDTFADTIDALMAAGADIAELNTVRRHLSRLAGGGLAQICAPAEIDVLVLSDVPGDDAGLVASGPFTPDPTTLSDARRVIDKRRILTAPAIAGALFDPSNETPKEGDACFARVRVECLSAGLWIRPVTDMLSQAGYEVNLVGADLTGDARDLANHHAKLAAGADGSGRRVALLSGGEATVTVRGPGTGGPNCEFALSLAIALAGHPRVASITCDTDGIDGITDWAGGIVLPDTLERAQAAGLDPSTHLAASDSGTFFAALGDAVVTGPTRTNVNDCRIVLVG